MLVFEVTKTKEEVQSSVDSLFRDFMNTASQHGMSVSKPQQHQVKGALSHSVLSGDASRAKLAKLSSPSPEISAQAMNYLMQLSNIDAKDIVSDEQAAHNAGTDTEVGDEPETPVEPDNLPATINNHLQAAGTREVEFVPVKHLPGYLREPIRVMGRQVFSTFTDTPIEDINVLANLNGMGGPNDISEINAVAGYARKHGTKDTHAEMSFNQSMDGYEADVAIYTADGITYMLVQDFMGKYVYSWPSKETKRIGESTSRPKPAMKALHNIAKAIQRRLKRY